MSTTLNITEPHMVFALGSAARVELLVSTWLGGDDDEQLGPPREFIERHGLVLAAQEKIRHPHFLFGAVEASIYTTPATRNAGSVELIPTIDGFAGTTPDMFVRTALEFVNDHWPFGPEAEEFDDDDDEDAAYLVN